MPNDHLPIPAELAIEHVPFDPDLLDVAADLVANPDGDLPEVVRRWTITDERGAEWAMRHAADAQLSAADVRSTAAEWRERINEWEAQRLRPIDNRVAFFAAHLEMYALAVRDATGGKVKTLTLPSGSVPTRSTAPKVVIEEGHEDEVLSWAWGQDESVSEAIVRTTHKVLLDPLREHVAVTEVADLARMVLSCGCVLLYAADDDWDRVAREQYGATTVTCVLLSLGEAARCVSCEADALVGQLQVLASHHEARDVEGKPVPGCVIEPGNVTAKAKPAT